MRDIKGYEGQYAITSCGRVWSYKSKKFLSLKEEKSGYLRVGLCKDGKQKYFLVHRLVAEAYVSNLNSYETVDHIDNCKTHNYPNNLQWMTRRDNTKKTKGTQIECVETGEIFESYSAAAKVYNKAPGNIRDAVLRGGKSAGYHWKIA